MKKNRLLISPSILSADFSRLADEIQEVEKAGCDMIHVDVMDGHFVPNLTIGPPVVKAIRKVTKIPLDVHLMIDEPIKYVEDFSKAGADIITFHVEATDKVAETIEAIKKAGKRAGLSVKPNTGTEAIEPYLPDLDLVLVMTVEPGFGGQSFMPGMMEKLKYLKTRFSKFLSVDGGINAETASTAIEAGANVLVAGTAIFAEKDRSRAIQILRGAG